jgi:NADH-quinone oxidoreductase subunit J
MISLFSNLALVSAFFVIRANNPVHSVLFLIFAFCNVSALLICHSLDFFAFIFLVVYVGAIAVLFLFVVMMLNVAITQKNPIQYLPIGGFIGFLFLSQILILLDTPDYSNSVEYLDWHTFIQPVTNIEAIGQVLYTTYAPFFILASLILLVAMIGAIFLTMLKSQTVRRQAVFEQNTRLFALTIQKMKSNPSIEQ